MSLSGAIEEFKIIKQGFNTKKKSQFQHTLEKEEVMQSCPKYDNPS